MGRGGGGGGVLWAQKNPPFSLNRKMGVACSRGIIPYVACESVGSALRPYHRDHYRAPMGEGKWTPGLSVSLNKIDITIV